MNPSRGAAEGGSTVGLWPMGEGSHRNEHVSMQELEYPYLDTLCETFEILLCVRYALDKRSLCTFRVFSCVPSEQSLTNFNGIVWHRPHGQLFVSKFRMLSNEIVRNAFCRVLHLSFIELQRISRGTLKGVFSFKSGNHYQIVVPKTTILKACCEIASGNVIMQILP